MTASACGCGEFLLSAFAGKGIEVVVSDRPLVVDSGYKQIDSRCPHGTLWYAEPTQDQVLRWRRDGVR